jgi:molybdopterin synthase sulfur carrier subunit
MIDVLYFASLREQLECEHEQLAADPDLANVGGIRRNLAARGGHWQSLFDGNDKLLVAVNQQMAQDSTAVGDGDEVAFFPPVTGG